MHRYALNHFQHQRSRRLHKEAGHFKTPGVRHYGLLGGWGSPVNRYPKHPLRRG